MRKRIAAEIPAERVASLRDFLLEKQKRGEFDVDKVRGRIQGVEQKRSGEAKNAGELTWAPLHVVDAATTILLVRKNGELIEVEYCALGQAVEEYPAIESLARFHEAVRRVQRMPHELYAGGEESCQRYAELATQALRREHPDAEPIRCKHLEHALLRSSGERVLRFRRTIPLNIGNKGAGGSGPRIARLVATDPPDADPTIEVSLREVPKRDGDPNATAEGKP